MNPFELRGPEFLLFYVVFTVVALFVTRMLRRMLDGGDDAPPPETSSLVSDPYAIAQLRGGAPETLRVALMSLVDRGLITHDSRTFRTASGVEPGHVRRTVERALVELFLPGGTAASLDSVKGVCDEIEARLERLRLLPDAMQRMRRFALMTVMIVIVDGVAGIKIAIGISRGRPVLFLIILSAIALLLVLAVGGPRRTAQGDDFLNSVRRLFAGLRQRKASLQRGGATADLALLAAVFGVTEVPASVFPSGSLFVRTESSSASSGGCGSSSSSSCGGGGGCGGGGCGGCGGD